MPRTASFTMLRKVMTLKGSFGSSTSIRWCGTPQVSSFVTFAVPMSIPRYTCMESALTISPPILFARATERAVFPTAVGPAIMISGCFIPVS